MAKYGVATISTSTAGGGVRTCAAELSRARHQSVFDAAMASAQESGLRENCTSRLSERAEGGRTLDLSRLYRSACGQPQGDVFAQVLPPVMLGSLTAILLAGTLNFLGKRYPHLTGEGHLQPGEHDDIDQT